ncbi:sensor histidine kinase [bacterium]|nr:sensor histidine kinase [bacterium]
MRIHLNFARWMNLRSVKTKITLRVGAAVSLLILALIVVVGLYVLPTKVQDTIRYSQSTVSTLAEQIAATNNESLTLARSLTVYQQSVGFGRRDETIRYLHDLKAAHPHHFGTWVLYAPNADGQDRQWIGKPGGDPKTGRFLPFWNPGPTGLELGVASDVETLGIGLWSTLKQQKRCLVTEPYFYNNELQCSYGCPILIDGQFKGIAGVDRSLALFDRKLRNSKPFASAMFVMLSPQGRYLTAPEERLLTRSLTEFPDQARVFQGLVGATQPGFQVVTNPFNHQRSWMFSVPIQPGGWTLAMLVDRAEILAPVHHLLQLLVIIGTLGLALIALLLYSLIAATIQPISGLAKAGLAISEGDIETLQEVLPQAEHIKGEDEFARMANAFQEARRYLVSMSEAFERIAQGDLQVTISPRGPHDRFGQALKQYVQTISDTIQQLETKRNELFLANQDMEATVENLRRLDQLRASFLNIISHDLRIPITAIMGYAELLQEMDSSSSETKDAYVAQILAACAQMQTMLEELLEYARLQTGRIKLDLAPVDVAEALSAIVAFFHPLAEQKGLRIGASIPPDLPLILVDPDRFQQIMNNVVSNAIKYTPAGGEVALRASVDGRYVAVEVQDTGIGLTEEDKRHLFEQFYRSARPEVQQEKGSGIGLAYVKGILEAQGGRIEVASSEGTGATFRIFLPQSPPSQ